MNRKRTYYTLKESSIQKIQEEAKKWNLTPSQFIERFVIRYIDNKNAGGREDETKEKKYKNNFSIAN